MMGKNVAEVDLRQALKHYFGYDSFRGRQEEVIRYVLERRNVFVIMPTGAGKSLCYQLPALLMEGTAVVISPLVALMKNQVDQLRAYDIAAGFLNSSLSRKEYRIMQQRIARGEMKLLYVAPETFLKDDFLAILRQVPISFIAIDEAHCISEWGHDFRPEYRKLRPGINTINPNLPIMALTATATPKVQLDIQQNLEIQDAVVIKTSFNRPNLYYEIRPKTKDTVQQIIRYIKQHPRASGIVYCLSRKKTEELAKILNENGITAVPYHAGLDSATRTKHQDMFLNEDVRVVVATIAFGMGIDKPDVRFVIHHDVPKSIESYYQETGRAGRDGRPSDCILFYDYNNLMKLEKFLKDKPLSEREAGLHLLFEMATFCESAVCRRKQILHYFGESFDEKDCNKMCDNCRYPKERYDGTLEARLALEAVRQTHERFDMRHLIRILLGKRTPQIRTFKHDQLPIFGQGSHRSELEWKSIYTQLIIHEYLKKEIEDYGVIKLLEKGKRFLEEKKPQPIYFFKPQEFTSEESDVPVEDFKAYDEVLFDKLLALRNKIAKEEGLPPYVIFQEASLEDMAMKYPITMKEFENIIGVGPGKARKYGRPFIELIREYVEENQIERPEEFMIRTSSPSSAKEKLFIIQQIDKRIPLDEIARMLNISFDELLTLIEQIIYSGSKINISYYIEEVLDPDAVEDIWDYFMNAETDDLAEAEAELGDEYDLDVIRLVRIQFYSHYAN